MDYSHLHTYAPPQCLPENTGYTYALSSSYSSAALDFENLHKLEPVFDSPRMSRRSLRLATATTGFPDDLHNESIRSQASKSESVSHDRSLNRSIRQQHNSSRLSTSSSRHSISRKSASNTSILSSSHLGDASMLSSVLDDSLIAEQTKVHHLWGLDEEDLKAGDTTVIQANADCLTAETQTTLVNGYTCNDCSMLSDRSNVLTAYSASSAPALSTYSTTSKVFSRDRNQKHKSTHSNFCGSMNVKDYQTEDGHLRINGESLCDDCKETHTTAHMASSRAKRVTGTLWHIFSYTGYFLMQAVRNAGSAGWFVSRKMLSFLWLAIVSPGKAASGIFWWLGTGWYQLSTLVSLMNVFVLTRCIPKAFRILLFLIPLLLLLGLGMWLWGYADKKETGHVDGGRMHELEKKLGVVTDHHDLEDFNKLRLLVLNIQEQIGHMNHPDRLSTIITSVLNERFANMKMGAQEKSTDGEASSSNHEDRILHLETILGKLTEAIAEDRKRSQFNASDEMKDHSLRKRVDILAQEFEEYKAAFLTAQAAKSSCDLPDCVLQKVDARVRESINLMFRSQENLPESLLHWISANYVSNADLNSTLQELELRILKEITHQVSISQTMPTRKVVEGAVAGGISGITEEEAHVIVNNALRLYSQDRTGMVDYALESGGGSILGTRCSETYETRTALVSLFGIPLWYLSQSPRVVIQPDMYPGNCWAFKGTQGYLVIRLSMHIFPNAFSLEHIPKSLSPTGNITSAPKDFAVYGLESEYQEAGVLLVQSVYNEEGEPLQTFRVTEENEKAFQIVELRILSNWGHTDYTCLYRFRAHGTPMK